MTIRILCTGDFQLGKSFSTLGESAKIFREQLMTTFNDVIDNHGKEYDLILIAGDLFDRAATPTSLIEEVADTLANCPKPCVVLPGNHDAVNTGIPKVLIQALSNRKADHVHVPIERTPLVLDELGVTLYPAPLMRRDDLSDQHGWIPKREKSDGVRIALMHGALTSMPNGQIPEDLAKQKDLDLVICGDQHGPKQSVEQSNLFNLETSKQRRLYYAMAPEAMTITQNFIGSYLRLEVDPKGKVVDHQRLDVGKLRFHNVVFNFDEDSTEALEAFLSLLEDHIEETTSVRVTLKGKLIIDKIKELREKLQDLMQNFRLFEVVDELVVLDDDDEPSDFSDTDPVVRAVKEALESGHGINDDLKHRAIELLRLNMGRWA
jgi:hypothetical protein